jgi:hypothetical protein
MLFSKAVGSINTMKALYFTGFAAVVGLFALLPRPASATNVGTGLVPQLAYLGEASQPDRIPLAPAITRSNYGYGTYGLISESRPCYHGHFLADGRPEYEQNLAVLFGVAVEFSDPTQIPGTQLTLRLKPCKPPVNAPYSQEQVMAAVLQTIVGPAYGLSKESPLTVVIEGDGMPTPPWASKYAKPYFNENPEDEKSVIPVPGVRMETSAMGVRSIVFTEVAANAAIKRRDPVFIPFTFEGEGDNEGVCLVPVWHGDAWSEPMNVLVSPTLPFYERWSGHMESSESVAVPHLAPPNPLLGKWSFHINRTDTGTLVAPRFEEFSPTDLAAFIYACITTIQPTAECPLTISLADATVSEEYQAVLRKHPAWNEGVFCEFVLEPSTLKLLKGVVPEFRMEFRYGSLLVFPEAMQRLNDTSTEPEKRSTPR